VFNFDRPLDFALTDVADCLAQGHIDGAIAVWQGLMTTDFPKTDQQTLRDLGLMLLEQGDFEQRWLVSKELLKFGEGIIAPLLTHWQNPSATIEHRWFAGRLLGNFVGTEITVALTEIFSQPGDQDLWAIAAEGLSKQGTLALTAISALLTNPDSRSLAVSILAQLSQPEALPLLKNLATDQDPTIRAQALQALGQYSPAPLMPIFLQAIADPFAKVRRQGVEGLGLYLKSLPPQSDPAQVENILHQLHPLLLDLDPVVCQQTAIAISQSPTAASIEILAKTLASPHTPEPLRFTVIKCLGWMETEASLAALATVFANPCHGQSLADLTLVIQTLGRIKTPLHQLTAGKILLTFAQSNHPYQQNPNLRKQLSQSWAQLHYLSALSLLQSWQNEADIGVKLHAQAALKILAGSVPTSPETTTQEQGNVPLD
jgi:HEAT repeat protein